MSGNGGEVIAAVHAKDEVVLGFWMNLGMVLR